MYKQLCTVMVLKYRATTTNYNVLKSKISVELYFCKKFMLTDGRNFEKRNYVFL